MGCLEGDLQRFGIQEDRCESKQSINRRGCPSPSRWERRGLCGDGMTRIRDKLQSASLRAVGRGAKDTSTAVVAKAILKSGGGRHDAYARSSSLAWAYSLAPFPVCDCRPLVSPVLPIVPYLVLRFNCYFSVQRINKHGTFGFYTEWRL